MSTYTSSTSTLRACLRAVQQALPGLERAQEALMNGLTSQTVADFAATIGSLPPRQADVSTLTADWSELQSRVLPDWEHVLSSEVAGQLRDVEHWVTEAGLASTPDAHTAEQAYQLLGNAVLSAAEELGSMEQAVVAEAAALSLPELGYIVQRADGIHATAFEASRGHEKLLVIVGEGGTVVTDHAGLTDNSCGLRQDAFVDAMARRGVALDESARQQHGDPRGGSPIVASARHRSASLAQGAVAEADQNWGRSGTASLFPRGRDLRRAAVVRGDAR